MAKTTHVVLTTKARGHQIGDVIAVESARADELVSSGLARKPVPGEVKAAKDSEKS